MAKYISGKFKNLKVGIKDYSEGKVALNIIGIVSAASYQSGSSGITSTGATFENLNITGVSTFVGDANFLGNVSIGGTLTYEDVTNVDSVGLVTAQTGVRITSGGLVVNSGVSTFAGNVLVDADITTNNLNVRDNGTGNPTVLIATDDQNPSALRIKNDTYHSNTSTGFSINQRNTGAFHITGKGNSEFVPVLIRSQDGSSTKELLQWDAAGNATFGYALSVAGVGTFNSDLHVGGQIIATNVDSSFQGAAFTGNIFADANLSVDGYTELDDVNIGENLYVAGISTFNGNINANGNIVGDNSTNITGINSVTATTFYGDGSKLTGVAGGGIAGINTTGKSYFKDLDVSGNLEVAGITTLGTYTHANRIYFGSGNSQFIDTTGGINLQTNTNRNITLLVNASGGSSGSIKLQKSSGSDSLVVHGHGGISIAGVTTFGDDVNVGAAITMYGATGIISATKYYGDGSGLTGVSGGGIAGINTTGKSYFKDVDVSGNLEVTGISTFQDIRVKGNKIFLDHGQSMSGVTTIGTYYTDRLDIFSAIGRDINPYQKDTYNLGGTDDFRWKTLYVRDIKESGGTSTFLGSVGIGTTNPNAVADTNNTTIINAGIVTAIKYYGDGSALTGISGGTPDKIEEGNTYAEVVDSGSDGHFKVVTEGVEILHVASGTWPQVGIGTNNPQDSLHIRSGTPGIRLADGNLESRIKGDGGNLTFELHNSSTDFSVRTSVLDSSTIFKLKGSGKVGIGSIEPKSALDVNGDVNVGAAITMYGATGIISATKYYGDGSALTNITASGTGVGVKRFNTTVGTAGTLNFGTGLSVTDLSVGIVTITGGQFTTDPQQNLYAGYEVALASDANTCHNLALGYEAASSLKGGDYNILLGYHVGAALTDASNNIMIGECAGYDTTSGEHNIFLGKQSGRDNITGGGNFAAGESTFLMSGASQKNASNNIAIGKQAASRADQGTRNITLGLCAGYWNSSGDDIVALGYGALCCNISGDNNIGLGVWAGYGNTTGSHNIFMGTDAGKCLTGASHHVAIGYHAARNCSHSTTDGGVYIGYQAGKGASGNWDVLIGKNAGECASSGGAKIGLGACALRCDRGNYNIGVGFAAGSNLNGLLADRNIAIGCNVSFPKSDGDCQLVIGQGTDLWLSGNSDFNVGIGTTNPNAAVGVGNTAKLSVGIVSAYQLYGDGSGLTGLSGWAPDAQNNLVAGTLAGSSLDNDTYNNIAIGYSAGTYINSGDSNILMGREAGVSLTSGSSNIFFGCWAGRCNTTGCRNIAFGYEALKSHCGSGSENIVFGTGVCAGSMITGDRNIVLSYGGGRFSSGNSNIALGSLTMMTTGFSTSTVAIGECAGNQMANTSNNIVIGKYSGRCIQFGCCNVYIGCGAGQGSCTTLTCNHGDKNIGIGIDALRDIRNANVNVAIGCHAGTELLCGGANVLIGAQAGCKITNGDSNTFVGTYAGKCAAGDYTSRNTFVGYNAGGSQASFTGRYNVAMGSYAGAGGGTGCNNVFIGKRAGCSGFGNADSGNHVAIGKLAGCGLQGDSTDNIFLGCCTGHATCGGSMQIMIGRGVNAPILNGSHQFAIGIGNTAWLTGNSDFNVGIGTTNPDPAVGSGNTAKLSVGIVSAYQYYGDGSNLTGVSGGGVSGVGTFDSVAGVAHTINQYTIASSSFETSEYTVYVGIGTKIQSQKALVMEYDGTAYSQEYGVMYNKDHIVSVGARVVSGVVRVEVTPETGVSGLTTYRFSRQTT